MVVYKFLRSVYTLAKQALSDKFISVRQRNLSNSPSSSNTFPQPNALKQVVEALVLRVYASTSGRCTPYVKCLTSSAQTIDIVVEIKTESTWKMSRLCTVIYFFFFFLKYVKKYICFENYVSSRNYTLFKTLRLFLHRVRLVLSQRPEGAPRRDTARSVLPRGDSTA